MNNFTKLLNNKYQDIPSVEEAFKIESLARDYVATLEGINSLNTEVPTMKVPDVEVLTDQLRSAGTNSTSFALLKEETNFLNSMYSTIARSRNDIEKYKKETKKRFEDIENDLKKKGKSALEIENEMKKELEKYTNSIILDPAVPGYKNNEIAQTNIINYTSTASDPSARKKFLNSYQVESQKLSKKKSSLIPSVSSDGSIMELKDASIKEILPSILDDQFSKFEEGVISPLAGDQSNPSEAPSAAEEKIEETQATPEKAPESSVAGVSPIPKQSATEVPKATPGAEISPETPQIYRIREAGSEVDSIYDAKTGEKIESIERFKADYQAKGAVEVDAPDSVKQIYRDGEKIFDAKTGDQILDPSILGSEYKGAIEVEKPETPQKIEDYAPKGTKADDQEYLREGDIEVLKERQAQSPDKTAGEVYSEAMKDTGEQEILTSDKPKRKFTKIVRNEDGSIKTDENGKPVSEDYYLPVYTKEELEAMSQEDKDAILEKAKQAFISTGGTEEEWAGSQEYQAALDTLSKEASGDETYRAGEYAARLDATEEKMKKDAINKARSLAGADWDKLTDDEKNTKIEENLKEIKVKNNMGADVDYNISEEVNFSLIESEKRLKEANPMQEEIKLPEKTNPWASNANAAQASQNTIKPFEIAKEPEDTSLQDKKTAYRKVTKNRLAGEE